jgi:hypothetical protein
MLLVQGYVQWWVLVLAVLNPQILLLERYFIVIGIDQQVLCHVFFIVDACY